MNNKIKLIALDIDGTIMDSQFQISEKVKEAISKAQNNGIKVVLATGRMYSATVPIAGELGIKTPLITFQGSLIREFYNSDDVLLHYEIPQDLAKAILKEIRAKGFQANVYIDDELFVEDESAILLEYAEKRHIVYHKVDSFDALSDFSPTKILAIDNDPDKITELRDYLNVKFLDKLNIEKSMPIYCEIVNKDASKGNALLYLAKIWGIKQSEIMAIGDHDNDKEMLKVAGIGVAMGNGTEYLKKIADYVTETVNNDGVAVAIEKFALESMNGSKI